MEIIDNYELNNKTGLIFIPDLEKAFDKVSLDFIFESLDFFNFGKSLINWVRVLYNDIYQIYQYTSCRITNNGYISKSVPLSREVQHGCPLSPYLFIIAMEILAIKVRSNVDIKGLEVGNIQTKM